MGRILGVVSLYVSNLQLDSLGKKKSQSPLCYHLLVSPISIYILFSSFVVLILSCDIKRRVGFLNETLLIAFPKLEALY